MDIWLFSDQSKPVRCKTVETLPKQGFVWIHASYAGIAQALDKAEALTGIAIHEQHRQDCMNTLHPASFDTVKGYDLLILRSLADFDVDSGMQHTVQNCFLITKHLLVTIADRNPVFENVQRKLQTQQLRMQFTQDNLLYYVLKLIIDDFMLLRKPIASQLLLWQELLLEENARFRKWRGLLAFKNQLRWLNILMEEQQVAIDEWEADIASEMTDFMAVRIRDLQEHTKRVLKMSSRTDKELDALIQLHYTMLSRKTNDVMRILTLISAVFLPLTLITGFFGMNFTRMPLIETSQGFYMICLIIGLLPVALFSLFRWKRWF